MDDDQARELEALEGILSDPSAEPIKLSYGLLKSVTDNFSNEIGRGAFGVVYMGVLQNGDVAVKKLSNLHELPDKQFLDEITCLKRAKHENIVRFLGYCSEIQEELLEFNGANIMAEVKTKLLCFEYVPDGNIRHYLEEKPHEDDWHVRYQMIRGICQGLLSLHDKDINHLDLKPENVMLDAHMEAKITDFGLSRLLDQGKSMVTQPRLLGTPRYIAPEIIKKGDISFKSDIYALGIVIIELLTGISWVDLDNWDESLDMDRSRMQRCTEIARKCTDPDRHSRPTIHEVISELDELESMIPWSSINQLPVTPTAFPGNEMIDVYPLELKFPFVTNQEMCCHLTLTNKTDGVVLVNIPERYQDKQFNGILQPRFTEAITLRREAEEEFPSDTEDKLEILMLITGCHRLDDLDEQVETLSWDDISSNEDLLKAAHEFLGLELHRAMLTAVVIADDQNDSFEGPMCIPQSGEDEKEVGHEFINCMDVHPTEPWVLILGFYELYIWNWQTKERIGVAHYERDRTCFGFFKRMWCYAVKFIAREQWAVTGIKDGSILVFVCPTMDKVKKKFQGHRGGEVTSFAVHPTRPFLLSCSDSPLLLKLWDWNNDWSCTGIFHITSPVRQVMFNPKHSTTFATLHVDETAMTWRIGRIDPIAAMEFREMYRHGADNLTYIGHGHYTVVTNRKCIRICDLQNKKLVHTLRFEGMEIQAVACHPTRPVLVTASLWRIHIWDSTTYRLKKVCGNWAWYWRYWRNWWNWLPKRIGFTGSERLVIGYEEEGILVMDIDLE